VKNATACAKNLTALMKKLPEGAAPALPDGDDAVSVLVQSFLMCETTTEKAASAYRKLRDQVVDYNDLRVTMPSEMASYLGSRYPLAFDRCQRMRTVLRNIYLREHQVALDSLREAGKRDVKKYLESLEGIWPFVASRVMLLCFDVHAIPVDEQLRRNLVAAGAADEDADVSEISAWLARQVKAGAGLETHLRFQAWVEKGGAKPASKKTTTKKKAGATTRKTTRTTKKAPAAKKTRKKTRS
jgi:endonuclease III